MYNFAVLISVLAFIASLFSVIYSLGYARINMLHSIQKLVLEKSKDCNSIYKFEHDRYMSVIQQRSAPEGINYAPVTNEVIISIQLLDTSLDEYKQKAKRGFYIKLFWIQLDTGLREYFKRKNPDVNMSELMKSNLNTINLTFGHLYEHY